VRGDRTALLVVDMLNTYEHEDADRLAQSVKDVVPQIAGLIERARDHDVPLVYVNDNYGDRNSSSQELAERALAGQATEQCILYSALDGYVRHFEVVVPRDGVAHIYEHLANAAFEMMERNMHAQVRPAAKVRLG
jgi:nicotinamidase-related amidase